MHVVTCEERFEESLLWMTLIANLRPRRRDRIPLPPQAPDLDLIHSEYDKSLIGPGRTARDRICQCSDLVPVALPTVLAIDVGCHNYEVGNRGPASEDVADIVLERFKAGQAGGSNDLNYRGILACICQRRLDNGHEDVLILRMVLTYD